MHSRAASPTPRPPTAQVLRAYVSSESDLFFLYVLEVNEDDFAALKLDQGILVRRAVKCGGAGAGGPPCSPAAALLPLRPSLPPAQRSAGRLCQLPWQDHRAAGEVHRLQGGGLAQVRRLPDCRGWLVGARTLR